MKTKAMTLTTQEIARAKAILTDAAVRYAVTVEGDDATLIFLAEDAEAAAKLLA
jgi:hypothetical protein